MNKEEYDGQTQALQEQLQREVSRCHNALRKGSGQGFYTRSPEYSVIYRYVLLNLLFFTPADGAVGSFQRSADGGSGEAAVDVQSCEGLENAAFTNTTRYTNTRFSPSTTKQKYCRLYCLFP